MDRNLNCNCAIWGTPASKKLENGLNGHLIDSLRAGGRYFISGTALEDLKECADSKGYNEHFQARLTSWLVEQRRLGIECPEIMKSTLECVKTKKSLSVNTRATKLLQFMGAKSRCLRIGEELDYRKNELEMFAWSESTDSNELGYLLNYLKECGWLKSYFDDDNFSSNQYALTVQGHRRIEELEQTPIDSSRAFVAMWFGASMDEAWDKGIAPGVRDAGYEPVRIDRKEHVNKIDDEIVAEIRRSRFVVADFTQGDDGARGGVYYEAGFAHGLGIPVVFTCRKDALGAIHFDTNHYNHIVWETPEELRRMLAARISAVIGDGPNKDDVVR